MDVDEPSMPQQQQQQQQRLPHHDGPDAAVGLGGVQGSEGEGFDDDATSAKSARSDLQAMYMAMGDAGVCDSAAAS
jgi:hypothetical protein